jgi:hypothetical protein
MSELVGWRGLDVTDMGRRVRPGWRAFVWDFGFGFGHVLKRYHSHFSVLSFLVEIPITFCIQVIYYGNVLRSSKLSFTQS